MLTNATHLKGLTIRALDGELGTVDEFYFDDDTWAIRYLIVDTGGWLGGRRVLISPFSIVHADLEGKRLDVRLTKKQVENSPDVDTHEPVTRQHEAAHLEYYGYPYYWGGPYLWGTAYYPTGVAVPMALAGETMAERIRRESLDSHLRSSETFTGSDIEATDGEIGHVAGFVVDDEAWAIRYIEVATRNWWPGKKVLVAPEWIELVSWADSKVFIGLSREAIKNGPEYVESVPITREYENRLHLYYGLPPYWLQEDERDSAVSVTGAPARAIGQ
jgi:PRC-barrel domain